MHTNVCTAGIEPAISCVAGEYSHHYAKSAVELILPLIHFGWFFFSKSLSDTQTPAMGAIEGHNFTYIENSCLSSSLEQIIIISELMSPLLGHRPSLWITHKKIGP
jgi:hypothetical protein